MQTQRSIPINLRILLIIALLLAGLGIPAIYSTARQQELAKNIEVGLAHQERDLNLVSSIERLNGYLNQIVKDQLVDTFEKSRNREGVANISSIANITNEVRSRIQEVSTLLDQRGVEGYNLETIDLTPETFQNNELVLSLSAIKPNIEINLTNQLALVRNFTNQYSNKMENVANNISYIVGQPRPGLNLKGSLLSNATTDYNSLIANLKAKFDNATAFNDNETIAYVADVLERISEFPNIFDEIQDLGLQYQTYAITESPETFLDFSKNFLQKFSLLKFRIDFEFEKYLDPTSNRYFELQPDDLDFVQQMALSLQGDVQNGTVITKGAVHYFNDSYNLLFDAYELISQILNQQLPRLEVILSESSVELNFMKEVIKIELANFIETFNAYVSARSNANILIQTLIIGALGLLIFGGTIPFLNQVRKLTVRLDQGFSRIANYDLNIQKFDKIEGGELGRIQIGFNRMIDELRGILQSLAEASEILSTISETMASSSEEASASVTEVSDTISQIAYGASEQNRVIEDLSQQLQRHLAEVNDATTRINEASAFVKQVAKRTNILGLNASIEAAKAGHFGRGFNVVAENVRELSEDTKKSANEISQLIEDVSFKISQTVRTVIEEMEQARAISENTASGSEEANAATTEQVSMLHEISEQAAEIANIATELNTIMSKFNFAMK